LEVYEYDDAVVLFVHGETSSILTEEDSSSSSLSLLLLLSLGLSLFFKSISFIVQLLYFSEISLSNL
jgi:hypothetical protein